MAPTRMMQVRLMVLPASMNNSLLPKIVVLGSARLERWRVIHKFKVIKVKVVNVKSKWDIVFSNFVALFWRIELLTILICLLFGRFYNLKLRNRQKLEYHLLHKKGYPINLGWNIEKALTFVLQQMQPINGLSYIKNPHEWLATEWQMGNFTNPFFSLVKDWHSYIASEYFNSPQLGNW